MQPNLKALALAEHETGRARSWFQRVLTVTHVPVSPWHLEATLSGQRLRRVLQVGLMQSPCPTVTRIPSYCHS